MELAFQKTGKEMGNERRVSLGIGSFIPSPLERLDLKSAAQGSSPYSQPTTAGIAPTASRCPR